MSNVLVLDTNKQPLDPVHPGRARILLASGKAAVFKRYPFTIVMRCVVEQPAVHPLRLKIDPGSRTTGLALVHDSSGDVVFAAEMTHRGSAIKKALDQRRAVRRGRRQRKARYRPTSFSESQAQDRVACPVAGKPRGKCANLGEAARAPLSARSHQRGVGQIRSATDGAARDQQRGVPAGYAGWF